MFPTDRSITRPLLATALSACIALSACHSSRTVKGAAIGAAGGGAIGAAVGHASDNTLLGALIGAAVGGTAGGLIGRHMDKQAEELRNDLKGATVERVGEGIKITFDSGLLFDVDKSNLSGASKTNLDDLAKTLNKYEDTDILIEGHTDATGADDHNMDLSKRRAESVANYLSTAGVRASRFTTMGYGETQPIASNDTDAGRAQNRRVDIAIYANKRMKKAAENGELQ